MGHDVVIVGARCAGATLALLLARNGRRVALIDRDAVPSDTISTHVLFPNTLARLDEVGVLAGIRASHDIPFLQFSWRTLGHEVAGDFTPIGGFERASCIRRSVLDTALVQAAVAAGADAYFGRAVTRLLGAGTSEDPVRGVVLTGGLELHAPLVVGADGRTSIVARALELPRTREERGEMAFLYAYWYGLPPTEWFRADVHEDRALLSSPCEDGAHLIALAGHPSIASGDAERRAGVYDAGIRQFPEVLHPGWLDGARRTGDLVVVPEPMMRGYYRPASGPGWVLVGDAGHVTHPATAQGISDAIEQASFVADAVSGGDRTLDAYGKWRDERGAELYEWSFRHGRWPVPDRAGPIVRGLAVDDGAAGQWLDTWTRRVRPAEVITRDRLTRWSAAWAYDDGRRRLAELLRELDPSRLDTPVPACPAWSVRDVLAHHVGVARDATRGALFVDPDVWRKPRVESQQAIWTAEHVAARRGCSIEALLDECDADGHELERQLYSGTGPLGGGPAWLSTVPTVDLAVHTQDIRGALGVPGDERTPATGIAFELYVHWLGMRIDAAGLPALRLCDGRRQWTAGSRLPGATVTGPRFELFRAVSGRRTIEQIITLDWTGDPDRYLLVISPYPLPRSTIMERAVSAPC